MTGRGVQSRELNMETSSGQKDTKVAQQEKPEGGNG